jgi:hypothetical protein
MTCIATRRTAKTRTANTCPPTRATELLPPNSCHRTLPPIACTASLNRFCSVIPCVSVWAARETCPAASPTPSRAPRQARMRAVSYAIRALAIRALSARDRGIWGSSAAGRCNGRRRGCAASLPRGESSAAGRRSARHIGILEFMVSSPESGDKTWFAPTSGLKIRMGKRDR